MPLSRNCKIVPLRWHCILCGAIASTPILSNFAVYHIGINSYRKPSLDRCSLWKKLCGFTLNQPLTSVLCSNIKCVSELCRMAFRTFLTYPTLFSVETMQNDLWIMLQKILLNTQALRVLPPPTFQEYNICVPRNLSLIHI